MAAADWSFARRPRWLLSHLFALTVVVSFVFLGFWQLSRYHQRLDRNAVIESRSGPPGLTMADALDRPVGELDYQRVEAHGSYVTSDLVRVANRSQDGQAGQYVVGSFRLDDGRLVLINRGFIPLNDAIPVAPPPTGPVTLRGWARTSVPKGAFGATDSGTGPIAPRLDVTAVGRRLSEPVVPVAVQLEADGPVDHTSYPVPVPLPPLDSGPHISYMLQWWTFALLGIVFYLAMLRRHARKTTGRVDVVPDADLSTADQDADLDAEPDPSLGSEPGHPSADPSEIVVQGL